MTTVLNIIHSLTVGGAARTMIATAKHSTRLGRYEHQIATLDLQHTDPNAMRFAIEEGMKVPIVRNRQELLEAIKAADIVQVNWWQHPEMDDFFRSELPPCRLIGWFHCAGDRAPQLLTRQLVNICDFVIGGSSYTYLSPSIQTLPLEERLRKTDWVTGGADFSRLDGIAPRAHSGFNVGYIGTVNFVKMHSRFLELHEAVRIPDLKVIVCGGDMHTILREEAAKHGFGDRFDFRGYEQDIGRVLSELDVYGYPLCEDTYAASELNLQEAMYAGVPPVVFPHGGLKTLVVNEFNGLVVRSEREYAEAVEYLYHHPTERARLGRNARLFAEHMFGAHNHAAKMNDIYERVMRSEKRLRRWIPYPRQGLGERGTERFLDSLEGTLPAYEVSYASDDLDRIFAAEEQILSASPLMLSAGILPYAGNFPEDAHLKLWSGLALFGAGRSAEAVPAFLAAFELSTRSLRWRALWYIVLCAADCNEQDLLALTLEQVRECAPDFTPGAMLLAHAREKRVRIGARSILDPKFF